jgi:cytoskeletal protein CcmA (bactofilin family)
MATRINEDCDGPIEITERVHLIATITGTVVVASGAELRISGQVNGEVIVRQGGDLILLGTIKGAIINEGGDVAIFGFVGRVEDRGDRESWLSRGAIVGGRRAARPMKLSRFLGA